MRPHPRRSRTVLLLVLLASVLAGCTGGDPADTAVPTVGGTADGGLDGVRSPSDATGGTLRLVTGQLDSLDPQRSSQPSVWNLMRLYTRTLVTYSSTPGSTDQLVPDLATDLGTTPDGGRTWTFTLRPGAAFETGRAITSKDVKYGIERSFAVDVLSGGPNYVLDLLDPDSLYAGPYQDESPDRLGLSTIATPDDATITFTLSRADPDFPFVLALPSASPVPAESDTAAGYGADPVSSGPYAITSVDPETGIVLDRNPAWTADSDPVRTALPDQVVVRTGLTGLDRDQALLAGSADADLSGSGVQEATVARLGADEGLAGRADELTTGTVRLLALPTTVAPMTSPDCRAAVAAVVDRSGVQEALADTGDSVRSSVLWPRSLAGGPDDPDPPADPVAAREALTACGQPDGFPVTMAAPDVPATLAVAQALVEQFAAVGIVVTVVPLPAATYYTAGIGSPAAITTGGYGMVLANYSRDLPTPAAFLVPLVDSRSISDGAGNANYALLSDSGVDAAVDAAVGAGDVAAWAAVADTALATHAFVPLVENRVRVLAGQRLRNGVVMLPYNGYDVATAGVVGD